MKTFEGFLMQWEREFATTARVLGNLPPTALGYRPHPKSMTAIGLAWHLLQGERFFVTTYLEGHVVPEKPPEPPPTLHAFLQAYAIGHQGLTDLVRRFPEGWDRTVAFMKHEIPGSGLLQDVMLPHMIHHRGQFSVYLRLLDAKVPSIYGPSADDQGT